MLCISHLSVWIFYRVVSPAFQAADLRRDQDECNHDIDRLTAAPWSIASTAHQTVKRPRVALVDSVVSPSCCCRRLKARSQRARLASRRVDACQRALNYAVLIFGRVEKIPRACLRNIYFAFLYPHLFYGIELYANIYYSNLDKLVKLNNKLLRILQGKNRRSNVTDLYVNYRTLPLTLLHHFAVLVFVYTSLFTINIHYMMFSIIILLKIHWYITMQLVRRTHPFVFNKHYLWSTVYTV